MLKFILNWMRFDNFQIIPYRSLSLPIKVPVKCGRVVGGRRLPAPLVAQQFGINLLQQWGEQGLSRPDKPQAQKESFQAPHFRAGQRPG
ncbi:MAG: hypothetical protein PVI54_14895 [Desulfobacteraceae bacterium]|jgi:hypothetical protein